MSLNGILIVFLSIISATSRGIISVIDRYQIGIKQQSILQVNMLNNFFTILLVFIISIFSPIEGILPYMIDFRIIIYSLIVQLVAVGYSYLFKNMTVLESVISSKMSDLVIPFALFVTTGYFSFSTYFLSIFTTFLIFVFLNNKMNTKKFLKGILVIVPLLTLQAMLSPILTAPFKESLHQIIVFTICTLYIRFFISILSCLFDKQIYKKTKKLKVQLIPLYFLRSFLTISAQFTFVVVTSDPQASIAWIFLNMTSLFGVIFSNIFLKERNNLKELVLVFLMIIIVLLKEVTS